MQSVCRRFRISEPRAEISQRRSGADLNNKNTKVLVAGETESKLGVQKNYLLFVI